MIKFGYDSYNGLENNFKMCVSFVFMGKNFILKSYI